MLDQNCRVEMIERPDTGPHRSIKRAALLSAAPLILLAVGCSQAMPDRAERLPRGYIYYLDGAGGGGLMNWSGGIRSGLVDAGYPGAGEMFTWNTGKGVVADQESSVKYKRAKAAEVARKIRQYRKEYPSAPVTLMGLSAGTAVAVFTLEALPVSCPVDNVILLGASISADDDLTKALQRVRNRMYVFTSEKDAVLAFAVPMAGTADRKMGAVSAGLRGFQMPPRASAETRSQYAKIAYIPWRPEFRSSGNFGGHTDTVKAAFVRSYIAPLIMKGMARREQQQLLFAAKKVRNPDYDRWADFAPGAWASFEGVQVEKGVKQPIRITAKLVSKHEDKLVIERTYESLDGDHEAPLRVQTFVAMSEIDPQDQPLTHPDSKITRLRSERITIGEETMVCQGKTVDARGEFPQWGRDIRGELYTNNSVPGGLVKLTIQFKQDGRPYKFDGQLVDFGVGERHASR